MRARDNILSCFVLIFSLFRWGEVDSSYLCCEKMKGFLSFRELLLVTTARFLLCVMILENIFQAITIRNQVWLIARTSRKCDWNCLLCLQIQLKYKNIENAMLFKLNSFKLLFLRFWMMPKKQAFLCSFQTYVTRNSLKDVQVFSLYSYSTIQDRPFLPLNFNVFIQTSLFV